MAAELTQAQRDAFAGTATTVYRHNSVDLIDSENDVSQDGEPTVEALLVIKRDRKRGGKVEWTVIDSDGIAQTVPADKCFLSEAEAWDDLRRIIDDVQSNAEGNAENATSILEQIDEIRAAKA